MRIAPVCLLLIAATHVDRVSAATLGLTSVVPNLGNFDWTYSLTLQPGDIFISADYVTLYDFGPIVAVSAPWVYTIQPVGITPASVTPPDNPLIQNITFSPSGIVIGPITVQFIVTSPTGLATPGTYSETYRAGGALVEQASGVAVPLATATPEPSTIVLLGTGLLAIDLRRRMRRQE